MSFRKIMDTIWGSSTRYYLQFVVLGLLIFGYRILPFSENTCLVIGLSIAVVMISFNFYFLKTIGRGHQDLVRIYKQVIAKENHKKAWLMLLLFFLIFTLIHICTNYDEYRGVAFAMLIVVIFFFGILYFLTTSSESTLGVNNNFVRLVVTKSKLVVYSSSYKIFKFDRSTLKYYFTEADELRLLGKGQYQHKELIVNLNQLPKNDKEELQSLLGERSENLNRD